MGRYSELKKAEDVLVERISHQKSEVREGRKNLANNFSFGSEYLRRMQSNVDYSERQLKEVRLKLKSCKPTFWEKLFC